MTIEVTYFDQAQAMLRNTTRFIVAQVTLQLGTPQHERRPSDGNHDKPLQAGASSTRPSLNTGVPIFCGETQVIDLRTTLSPNGTIDDLLDLLRVIIRRTGTLIPDDCELFAVADEHEPAYQDEPAGYIILARYMQ